MGAAESTADNRTNGEHLRRLLSFGVGDATVAVYVDPATVTSIFPAGLPGVSRIHHNGSMLDLVNGTPDDVHALLFAKGDA